MAKKAIDVAEIYKHLVRTKGVLDNRIRIGALSAFLGRIFGWLNASVSDYAIRLLQLGLLALLSAFPLLMRQLLEAPLGSTGEDIGLWQHLGGASLRLLENFPLKQWLIIVGVFVVLRLLQSWIHAARARRKEAKEINKIRRNYRAQKLNLFRVFEEKYKSTRGVTYDASFKQEFTEQLIKLVVQMAEYHVRPGKFAHLSVSFFVLKGNDTIELHTREPVAIQNLSKPNEQVIAYYACLLGGSIVVNDFQGLKWEFRKFSENGGDYKSILSIPVLLSKQTAPAIGAVSIDSDRPYEFADDRVRTTLEEELSPYLNLLSRVWGSHRHTVKAKDREEMQNGDD